jgi:predicted nucleotidyltransferase component of viral defense system
VVSIELESGGKTVFSFQIAARSAQIDESRPAPWPPGLLLDSLHDLIAAKVVALVERGAPRDFRDIYAVCETGLADVELCWSLWRRRRALAGDDTEPGRARLALLTHLERIELHRPLPSISDPRERESASSLRNWFRGRFLDGILD